MPPKKRSRATVKSEDRVASKSSDEALAAPKAKKVKTEEKDDGFVIGGSDTQPRRVYVSEFKGQKYVAIREWYTDKASGELRPGKAGIQLKLDEFRKLAEIAPEILRQIEGVESKPVKAARKVTSKATVEESDEEENEEEAKPAAKAKTKAQPVPKTKAKAKPAAKPLKGKRSNIEATSSEPEAELSEEGSEEEEEAQLSESGSDAV